MIQAETATIRRAGVESCIQESRADPLRNITWFSRIGARFARISRSSPTAPLSPAIHLGARQIIAVSTRYERSREEADRPAVVGYPPPAQVAGVVYNAIFLDQLDADALSMQQIQEIASF